MQEFTTGNLVEVIAEGITYRGILKELGENEIYLESESGWIVIPMEKVADMKIAE